MSPGRYTVMNSEQLMLHYMVLGINKTDQVSHVHQNICHETCLDGDMEKSVLYSQKCKRFN